MKTLLWILMGSSAAAGLWLKSTAECWGSGRDTVGTIVLLSGLLVGGLLLGKGGGKAPE